MRRMVLFVAVAALVVSAVTGGLSTFLASGSVQSPWVIEDLGSVAGKKGGARDINERGQIVGWVDSGARGDGAECLQVVLWEEGTMREVGQRDCSSELEADVVAMDLFVAINERGQIVGSSEDESGEPISHAFLWQNGETTDLGSLGGKDSVAAAINDGGQIVGTSATRARDELGGWIFHGFVWQNGTMTDLGTLGGPGSAAYAINDRGQVAGVSHTEAREDHAFLWQDRKMRDLGTLRRHYLFGGQHVSVTGINEQGEVAGSSRSGTGGIHAVVWQQGKMIDLGTLGGRNSFATAVNARGQVVGDSSTGTGRTGADVGHAFVWENGSMTDLGALGFGTDILGQVVGVGDNLQATRASAINERGDVVGWSTTRTGKTHAFVWQNGRMIDLGTLKGDGESGAVALNEHGQIVGWSRAESGEPHPVLWTLRSG